MILEHHNEGVAMPRCFLNTVFVENLKHTTVNKRTVFADMEYRSLHLEYQPDGSGAWYFKGKDGNGKTCHIHLGTLDNMDILEARAQAYDLQKYIAQGGKLNSRQSSHAEQLTFREFIEKHYLPHARIRKRSWKTEVRMLERHIFPYLDEQKLDTITRISLSSWQEAIRKKGLAPATCNRVLFLLKYALNCARRWEFIEESPARDIHPLPEREFRERYLSVEEAQRLLTAIASEPDKKTMQAIQLLLFTGARKTEILSARWENVDMTRRILTVPLSKSGRTRYIPLSDAALSVLRDVSHDSDWLFPSPKTDSYITTIYSAWDRVRCRANLKDVRLHDLRHSFASFLVNSGCSLYEVQKILGHHDPKVTTRYAHLDQECLLKAANIVGSKLGIQGKKTPTKRGKKRRARDADNTE